MGGKAKVVVQAEEDELLVARVVGSGEEGGMGGTGRGTAAAGGLEIGNPCA